MTGFTAHIFPPGTTAEKICVCGDSAGGNLAIAMVLRAVAMGIRIPDGILSTYGVFLIRYTPSPARIMALMDPLLPLGLMASCLAGNTYLTIHCEDNGCCTKEVHCGMLVNIKKPLVKHKDCTVLYSQDYTHVLPKRWFI